MDIAGLIILTLFPLIYGIVAIPIQFILPVSALVLGIGTIQGKRSAWGIFLGFIVSFTFFRIVFSLMIKIAEIPLSIFQYMGIFFLILFGIMMIFPQYSLWKRGDDHFKKGLIYSSLLGFVWSFWVGLFTDLPDDYRPKWIGFLEVYLTLVSSMGCAIPLMLLHFILSKLYPSKYIVQINKVLGCFTLFISVLLMFHIIEIFPRTGLRPEDPPPVPLYEIFNLKKK